MEELLPFLQKNETWIYLLLGIIAFFPLQRLVIAWRQWQGTVFGLEREIAQRKFSAALTILVLLVVLVFMEFFVVSFVAPNAPQLSALATPTLDLLATNTPTLPALINVAAAEITQEATPTPEVQQLQEGCTKGQVEWLAPKAGEEISGTVELKGTINIPNLGYYKYEFSEAGEDIWTPIASSDQPKVEGVIGYWNTSMFTPGDYRLRLVVFDNQDQAFPTCVIAMKLKRQ